MQDCSISIANAMETLQSCTGPSIWHHNIGICGRGECMGWGSLCHFPPFPVDYFCFFIKWWKWIPTEYCSDVIMGAIASQITSLAVVYSTVYTDSGRHWLLCGEFTGTGEFHAQRASNAENVSIWWRHHDHIDIWLVSPQLSCNDTCQIWTLFDESNIQFCLVKNTHNRETNGRSCIIQYPPPRDQYHCLIHQHSNSVDTRPR